MQNAEKVSVKISPMDLPQASREYVQLEVKAMHAWQKGNGDFCSPYRLALRGREGDGAY
jgi:hypothetical protein